MLSRLPLKQELKRWSKKSNQGEQELQGADSLVRVTSVEFLASSSRDDQCQFKWTHQSSSVTVKIKNPEDVVVERFAELYMQLDSADVSIACGRNQEVLRAHRYVLSSGSAYFRDALRVAQCKHPVVNVQNISRDDMSQILEYLYLGHVQLKTERELQQFLKSANYLLVTCIKNDQYCVN